MSFLSAFQSIVAKLKAEGHSLAGEAEGLFGEAEKIVAGLASELAPAFEEIKTQLTADGVKLSAEAIADVKALVGEGTNDLVAEFAALKAAVEAFLGQTPVEPAAPAAPTA